jgi:hypothetical protein
VAWLARVVEAREFPLERLARNLEIAAEVVMAKAAADGKPSDQCFETAQDWYAPV